MSLLKPDKDGASSDGLPDKLVSGDADSADTQNVSKELGDMPLTEHFIEFRLRLIKVIAVIGIVFIPFALNASKLYDYFSNSLVDILPDNSVIISTGITENFMVPLRLGFLVTIFLVMPYILYQIWAFVSPGLYKHEKRFAFPILLASVTLFYTGAAFAYFIILRPALVFFMTVLPQNVTAMPGIAEYLSMASKLLMVFGLAFEIPVIVLILVISGIVSVKTFENQRRYVIVGCFAAAGILSPPDVASMLMLAAPMLLLFELGLFVAKLLVKNKSEVKS